MEKKFIKYRLTANKKYGKLNYIEYGGYDMALHEKLALLKELRENAWILKENKKLSFESILDLTSRQLEISKKLGM